MTEQQHDHARSDTRSRIQEVALDLFVKQGYEKTSLREIAEQLGVTKAALYYHFKTKEEIVQSTVHDYLKGIDALVAWGKEQQATLETRREVVRRYGALLKEGQGAMRFFQQNPAQGQELGKAFRSRMTSLLDLVRDPKAPLPEQIRSVLALMGQMFGMVLASEDMEITGGPYPPDEVRAAALDVALELLEPRDG